jgi:hypothetical protein
VVEKGVDGLLERKWAGARKPAVRGALSEEFLHGMGHGVRKQISDRIYRNSFVSS